MIEKPTKCEIADDTETQARAREVKVLLNIVEPDPEYQPFILTDEASLFDAVGAGEEEMLRRLALYFGGDFHFLYVSLSGNSWTKLNRFIRGGPTIGRKVAV